MAHYMWFLSLNSRTPDLGVPLQLSIPLEAPCSQRELVNIDRTIETVTLSQRHQVIQVVLVAFAKQVRGDFLFHDSIITSASMPPQIVTGFDTSSQDFHCNTCCFQRPSATELSHCKRFSRDRPSQVCSKDTSMANLVSMGCYIPSHAGKLLCQGKPPEAQLGTWKSVFLSLSLSP